MPRYIDAEKIKYTKFAPENDSFDGVGGLCALKSHIDAIPTTDVVEVVRCKNCRFFDPYDKVENFDGQCVVRDCETDKEEFCSYGSKRGDEK